MDIQVNKNEIYINSPIVTLSDVEDVIKTLNSIQNTSQIILHIKSFSLPSTIIGELIRLHDKGIEITINVNDVTLYDLLDALQLTQKFKIRKI